MLYRNLGRTGLKVSALSLGGAAMGQQYGPVSTAEVADCVHAAIDAGVNLIDTSAYYGKGRSEEMLGDILQGGWREKVYPTVRDFIASHQGPAVPVAPLAIGSQKSAPTPRALVKSA